MNNLFWLVVTFTYIYNKNNFILNFYGGSSIFCLGDHKQLRPLIATRELGYPFYNLDISLFERLTNNGIHCPMLNIQYRMHPEISSLISFIYPNLKNHESVYKFEVIKGVHKNVFFFEHQNCEEVDPDVSSCENILENALASVQLYNIASRLHSIRWKTY